MLSFTFLWLWHLHFSDSHWNNKCLLPSILFPRTLWMLPTTTTKYSQGSLAEQMFIDIFSSHDCWLTNTSLTRFELLKEKMFKSSSIIRDPRQQWPPSLLNKLVRVYCQKFLSFPKILLINQNSKSESVSHSQVNSSSVERQLHNKPLKLMKMGKYPRIAFLTPHHLKAFFTTTSRHQECLSLTICICHFSPLTSADTSMKNIPSPPSSSCIEYSQPWGGWEKWVWLKGEVDQKENRSTHRSSTS